MGFRRVGDEERRAHPQEATRVGQVNPRFHRPGDSERLLCKITNLRRSSALISPRQSRQIAVRPRWGLTQERTRQMRDGASRMVAVAIGAMALSCVGVGMAAAADVPLAPRVQQPPPPQYYAEEEYYEPPAYVV